MATWMTLEEESGTSPLWVHPHNGYFAGDFSTKGSQPPTRGSHDGQDLTMSVVRLVTGEHLRIW